MRSRTSPLVTCCLDPRAVLRRTTAQQPTCSSSPPNRRTSIRGVDPRRGCVHGARVVSTKSPSRARSRARGGVLPRRARHDPRDLDVRGKETRRGRPRAAPPPPAGLSARTRPAGRPRGGPARWQRPPSTRPVPDARLRVRRCAGPRRRRSGRGRPARPARRRDHQASDLAGFDPAAHPRTATSSSTPPRHDPRRRRPLRRHDAARGRARHRRRPRPRPGTRPRRGNVEGARLRGVRWAPALRCLADLARTQTASISTARSPPALATRRSTGRPQGRAPLPLRPTLDGLATVFGPTGRRRRSNDWCSLDQVKDWCADSRTKVTVKPVIDLNTQLHTDAYGSPTGSASRSSSATAPACSRGAPDPPGGCDIDHVIPTTPTPR